jgi:hypothetical protein
MFASWRPSDWAVVAGAIVTVASVWTRLDWVEAKMEELTAMTKPLVSQVTECEKASSKMVVELEAMRRDIARVEQSLRGNASMKQAQDGMIQVWRGLD